MATDTARPEASVRRGVERPPEQSRLAGIDGLRAVALALVVAYHVFGHGRVSGGVDVFFFVTGLVLTLSLIRTVADAREYRVWERWGRTFGRLAPPAAVVLLTVVALSFVVFPPWSRSQTLLEVLSSALYLENWQLIWSQLAYGAAGPMTSPVQHFWSLSVQAQVIVVLPLTVLVLSALRRFFRRPWAIAWVLAAAATTASFIFAVVLRLNDPAAAYFNSFARFWEFGVGVLLAGALTAGLTVPRAVGAIGGWIGMAAIVTSGLFIDGALMYPGPAALVPILGAALVAVSVAAPTRLGPTAVLSSRPFTAVNRIAYPLYLWHWPVLIVSLTVLDIPDGRLSLGGAIAVLLISIALATVTWWGLERPVQRVVASRDGRMAAGKVALISVLLAAVVPAAGLVASDARGSGPEPSFSADSCLGASALDPERPECATAADPMDDPIPAFEDLREDEDYRSECWATLSESTLEMCTVGLRTGYSARLLAVGDSHSNSLVGVYERIAEDRGWRIEVAGREGCHWTSATRDQMTQQGFDECARWNDRVNRHVAQRDYDAIIVMHSSRANYVLQDEVKLQDARVDGLVEAWSHRDARETPIIALRDHPIFPSSSLDCIVDTHDLHAGECAMPRELVILEDGMAEAVERDRHAYLVDLTDYICGPTVCEMVVGGVIVSRDGYHLTDTFAHTLKPYLERELARIVESGDPSPL
jgi:peptidoglycan/LPS O-acetylase OafA/YrhL